MEHRIRAGSRVLIELLDGPRQFIGELRCDLDAGHGHRPELTDAAAESRGQFFEGLPFDQVGVVLTERLDRVTARPIGEVHPR